MSNFNFLFIFLAFMLSLILFSSCEKEEIFNVENSQEEVLSELRSSANYDSLFRQSLKDLVNKFESQNDETNGSLAEVLDSIGDYSKEDALNLLDSLNLINVVVLEGKIDQVMVYESHVIQESGQAHADQIVAEESEGIFGNFWRDDCKTELVGGFSDGQCAYRTLCTYRYRFWINWGPKVSFSEPFDCPPESE